MDTKPTRERQAERVSTDRTGGETLLDLANSVVRIHKRFYGKGPTKARVHAAHDLVTVVLEGGFTRGEQTLRDSGHVRELADARLAMQSAVEGELRSAVEEIIGRRVRSFMSANDPQRELQVEVFVLFRDDEAPAQADLSSGAARVPSEHRETLEEHGALRGAQVQSREALPRRGDDR